MKIEPEKQEQAMPSSMSRPIGRNAAPLSKANPFKKKGKKGTMSANPLLADENVQQELDTWDTPVNNAGQVFNMLHIIISTQKTLSVGPTGLCPFLRDGGQAWITLETVFEYSFAEKTKAPSQRYSHDTEKAQKCIHRQNFLPRQNSLSTLLKIRDIFQWQVWIVKDVSIQLTHLSAD